MKSVCVYTKSVLHSKEKNKTAPPTNDSLFLPIWEINLLKKIKKLKMVALDSK